MVALNHRSLARLCLPGPRRTDSPAWRKPFAVRAPLSFGCQDWGGWVVFSLTGIVFKGMFLHYWYNILDR